MRLRNLFVSFGIAALVAPAAFADQGGHWQIVRVADGAYGYDLDSFEDSGGGKKIATIGLYLRDEAEIADIRYHYMLEDVEYDCAKQTYAPAILYFFDNSGQPVKSFPGSGKEAASDATAWTQAGFDAACSAILAEDAVSTGTTDETMKAMRAPIQ